MKEELISFETAKLAKEKGFSQNEKRMIGKYGDDGTIQRGGASGAVCDTNKEWFEAPTQSLLQKWLREEHQIDVNPICTYKSKDGRLYHLGIIFIKTFQVDAIILKENDTYQTNKLFNTYEGALEQGLQEALNLINP